MTESDPIVIDLRVMVPDPPDDLLDWNTLQRRVRRRRKVRSATALLASIVAVSAIVIGAVTISRGTSPRRSVATPVVSNGPILFARLIPGPSKELAHANLALATPAGTTLQALTTDPGVDEYATATRDGQRIAYIAETDTSPRRGDYQAHDAIRTVNIDGSDDHLLYTCHNTCDDLAWSPNGAELAFATNSKIDVVDLAGTVRTVCGSACGDALAQPAWSPDGQQIAFSQAGVLGEDTLIVSPSAIWVVDADGQHLTKLTDIGCTSQGRHCTIDTGPAWSPNGREIAFSRFQRPTLGGRTPKTTQAPGLFVMSPRGRDTHRIWTCPNRYCQSFTPQWSPDGTQLAFTGNPLGGLVYVVGTDGNIVASIAPPTGSPRQSFTAVSWSPDGSQLAMTLNRPHHAGAVYTAHADGADIHRLPISNVDGDNPPLAWLAQT